MPCFSIVSNLKSRKFSGKIRMAFVEIDPQLHRFWLSIETSKEYMQKKSWGNTIVHRFLQGILFHIQTKDGANITNIWSPKETVTAIIMPYKNTKAMVCSPIGNIDFFDIIAGVLQEDTLTPFLFICLDCVLWTSINLMKENDFTLKKKQEADNIQQKLLLMQPTEMIKSFLQIHLLKLNLSCIAWSRQ